MHVNTGMQKGSPPQMVSFKSLCRYRCHISYFNEASVCHNIRSILKFASLHMSRPTEKAVAGDTPSRRGSLKSHMTCLVRNSDAEMQEVPSGAASNSAAENLPRCLSPCPGAKPTVWHTREQLSKPQRISLGATGLNAILQNTLDKHQFEEKITELL